MYTFSNRLKIWSIVLIILGALGIAYGFVTAPRTTDDIKEMLHHEDSHGSEVELEKEITVVDKTARAEHEVDGHEEVGHLEHALTFAKNRPWAAIYVPLIFFLLVAVCALVFYAIQIAAKAGWSIVLYRIMEAVTAYILPGSVLILVFLLISSMHGNHMFAWMFTSTDPTAPNYDFAMETKAWWLNIPGFLIRTVIYVLIWIGFRYFLIKNSRDLAGTGDLKYYRRNYNLSVLFLVVFLVSELYMAFDWLMSIDHHWFSQLYPFYVFASMFVAAITVIAMITIYLKSRGFLPYVNKNHIHDLAEYMFAFSIFWTYLWFAQFMLQWYANIPEEATYFYPRLIGDYQFLFMGMLVLNFVFPIILLMSKDYKMVPWFVIFTGLIILIGHYLDVYLMIYPGTVGSNWQFGIPEIGAILFFLGLFIYVVFTALTKMPLLANKDPFVKESKIYHA